VVTTIIAGIIVVFITAPIWIPFAIPLLILMGIGFIPDDIHDTEE
jgi:hypothetical protein